MKFICNWTNRLRPGICFGTCPGATDLAGVPVFPGSTP